MNTKSKRAPRYSTQTPLPKIDWEEAIRGIQQTGDLGYRHDDREKDIAWLREASGAGHTVESLWYGELRCGRGWCLATFLRSADRRALGTEFVALAAARMLRDEPLMVRTYGESMRLSDRQRQWCRDAIDRPAETAMALLDRHMIKHGDPGEGHPGPLTTIAIHFFY